MQPQGLHTNPSLKVFRVPTGEEFRSFERSSETCVLPLGANLSSTRALVKLPTCSLVVQRTFPRIWELSCKASGTLCIVPLAPLVGVRINGAKAESNAVVFVRGQARLHVVEPHANLFAFLKLDPLAAGYDWTEGPHGVQIAEAVTSEDLRVFRSTITDLLAAASLQPQDTASLKEAERKLLSSLDSLTNACPTVKPPSHFARYLRIVQQIDEYQTLHTDAETTSHDLAAYCGVSSRTLQNATTSVRGMSLHRYLRLRKLWSVRRILTIGRPGTMISDVARANGFRHMGEFSQAYRSVFGETASATLGKNRSQEFSEELPLVAACDPCLF